MPNPGNRMARSTHHRHYKALLRLLRDIRGEVGLTQAELGQKLDNTQTFVSKVERGERRMDVVEFVEFCDALGIDPQSAFQRFLSRRGGATISKKVASQRRPNAKA